ncbi:SagB family peptide dehydrogenase [Amycolatopsis magusensis]|uniref:SagB family peptide dehydrogenase n=1 Tax=Amycolatopsis magusensis TaxID=882444 RepID=UPI0024A90A30|nr:SagB family peptide dehydrogenase [Amycolatopsis magusensis]MDI5980856.1 SagB family peptide dehydrogenase [Amycolatopsis magusensis]
MISTSDDVMTTVRLWSLSEDALVEEGDEAGSLNVVTRWGELNVESAGAFAIESLRRMGLGPVSLQNVVTARKAGPARKLHDLAGLERVLDQVSGSVVHSLGLADGQRPLLSVVPVVASPAFRLTEVGPRVLNRLSRFAVLRPEDGDLLLESPRAEFRVVLSQPQAVRIASSLAAPATVEALAGSTGVPEHVVADVVAFLTAAGVVLSGDDEEHFAEDADAALRHWSHHELLFHTHSRSRRGEIVSEAAYQQATENPPPLTKPAPEGERFPLSAPDLGGASPSLTELLENDHECPKFSPVDLTREQLGELLFRSARIRSAGPAHPPIPPGHDATQRPYFAIACLYELELYLSIDRCAGLPRAIYHYDPDGHALTLIDDDPGHLAAMLDLAKVAAGSMRRPAAMISVTARMERTAWVLGGAAYAVTLMHVGALQQTLYLCAKAMGLAAHAVPVDASDTVDRVLGLDWPAEIGVGECVLDALT